MCLDYFSIIELNSQSQGKSKRKGIKFEKQPSRGVINKTFRRRSGR